VAEETPAANEDNRDRPLDISPEKEGATTSPTYLLLSMLIEKLSGQSFASYCQGLHL